MKSLTRTVKQFKKQANLDFKAALSRQGSLSTWQGHAVFLLCIVLSYFFLDRPIAVYCHQHADELSNLNVVTHLGGIVKYLILFLCLAIIAKLRKQMTWVVRYVFLICWITGIYGICAILKHLLGRVRPPGWFVDHLFGFYGPSLKDLYHSFPSGHTTIWVSLACGFGLFFPKQAKSFFVIALLCASTRILLTDHYVSDVLGTIYLTCMIWFFVLHQLQKEST
ncbi:MAG: phosphatase PAP2 family protein [Gammaproteobacteria bacterium]|nr:phosphatase PAP2 family protein [Gammaproteobacteria bacterium]